MNPNLAPGIPAEKLQALLEASDEMMVSVFLRDRKATLDTMARHICKFLNAESCAILTVPEGESNELVLESSFTEALGATILDSPRLKIQSVPRGGITGHIANQGKIVRMSRHQLAANVYVTSPNMVHRHLFSGVCYSLMGIPLKNMGRLVGLLKPENKKSLQGIPGDDITFDEVDEQLARILANKAVAIITCLKIDEEHRRREEEHRRSTTFFSSMVERLDQSVFCKDATGRFTYVNSRFAERLRLSPSTIIGKTDLEVYNDSVLAARYRGDDLKVMETRKTYDLVEPNSPPGGETRHVRVIKTPIIDDFGNVIGVQGIFWDEPERYLLASLLDNIPDNVYFKDLQSRFTRINKHLAEQFRLSDPELALNKTDADFFQPAHADATFSMEQEIIRNGYPKLKVLEEEKYLDGRVRYVLTNKLPLRDSQGHIIGVFGISRDIDELVRNKDLFGDLLRSLKTEHTHDTMRTLFRGLRMIFGFTSAILYVYDEQKGTLKGQVAPELSESEVSDMIFVVGTKPSRADIYHSLVEAVFNEERAVFVNDVVNPPVNQETRQRLGLKPGTSAIGLPLYVGDNRHFIGIMVVCSNDPNHPIDTHAEATLTPYADICALALALAQSKESLSKRARILKTEALIVRHFSMISVNPGIVLADSIGRIAKDARKDLTAIVTLAVKLLRADLGALYLSDQAVCVSSLIASEVDQEYVEGTRAFILRAMYHYPKDTLDRVTYTPSESALTASVLATRRPRISLDIRTEPDWSRKVGPAFDYMFRDSKGLRTWMGVPIYFVHSNSQYLFGALSFTRRREHPDDKLAFTEYDKKDAIALASLLAMALQSVNVARMELTAAEVRLRETIAAIAVHNLQNPAVCIRNALGNIGDIVLSGTVGPAQLSDISDSVNNAMTQVAAILDTRQDFLDFIGPQSEDMTCFDLSECIDAAIRTYPTYKIHLDASASQQPIRAHRRAISTALRCLLQNALDATQQTPNPHIAVNAHLTVPEGIITVTDNGPGVEADVRSRLFEMGVSAKPLGSGLGLFSARTIMRQIGGDVLYNSSVSPGAQFEIRFLCQEG